MSRRSDARDRQTAATYPCANRCGHIADFDCTLNTLEPRRKEKRRGIEVVVEPYVHLYLCEACTKAAVVSQDPPRAVAALPHHEKRLKAQAAAERKAALKARSAETPARLGDWGGVGRAS